MSCLFSWLQVLSTPVRAAGMAALLATTLAPNLQADVSLTNIFSDHMVLQRDQANKVWGKAAPSETVTVKIADQSHSITADDSGAWHVMLQPLAAGGPHELIVSCDHNEVRIADVLVGEVWICSGQSNMQMNVNSSTNADLDRLAADHPNLRMINFPQVGTQEPVWSHPDRKCMVCTPETDANFSTVGYRFGFQVANVHIVFWLRNG